MADLSGSTKIRLPADRQPKAIDKELLMEALGLLEQEDTSAAATAASGGKTGSTLGASDTSSSTAAATRQRRRRRRARTGTEDEASREFLIKTAQTIRIEFKQILKVSIYKVLLSCHVITTILLMFLQIANLDCLSSLTRLFLDNNLIERIGGLDQLVHLTWLDLSFNRIRKIEGLESLKKLEVLALFANEIETVENLHHLSQLKVLRLGRNKIESKVYSSQFQMKLHN